MGLESHIQGVLEDTGLHKSEDFFLEYRENQLYLTTKMKRMRDEIYEALIKSGAFNPKKLGLTDIIFLPVKDIFGLPAQKELKRLLR